MEMSSDWKTFRSLFYPRRRSLLQKRKESRPVFVLLLDEKIGAIYSEAEDLSSWIGKTQLEFSDAPEMKDRKCVLLNRTTFDSWLIAAAGMNHYQEQLEFLHESATGALEEMQKGSGAAVFFKRHFVLEALRGWWSKVLPSAYGIFIRLEGQPGEDLFVLVRRGRLESYGRPDLSSLSSQRSMDSESIVKYLSEKHMIPVQGFFLNSQEWSTWAALAQPWRRIAMSIRSERVRLVPFRWSVVGLIAGRGFLSL